MESTDPKVLFGRHLAQLRKSKGWSQEKLALESGLARSYLGGVERGQRNVALLNICRLARALGMPPSALMEFQQ
jgi:transcriptional regulator with XRE-family HTH domain